MDKWVLPPPNLTGFRALWNNYQLEVDMVKTLATYLDGVAKGVSNETDN